MGTQQQNTASPRPRRRPTRGSAQAAAPAPSGELGALVTRLTGLSLRDEERLGRRLEGLRKVREPEKRERVLASITAEVDAAELRLESRRESVPTPAYPEELPVSGRREDILEAIRDHQVVIIAGETGSGKTTQIPKMCLELGRGVRGLIGHTQPRRIAARTVAERVAEELRTEIGETVGWKVRFTDQVGEHTAIKVMTDGILLAEIQNDRMLRQYDTLIIDEAHERSLNIDFILGYLKQLLPKRPDLKVIITSATIDPERFARHFADPRTGKEAPIIEVSGRTYPVEVRYRPIIDDSVDADDDENDGNSGIDRDRDQVQAIVEAVDELGFEGQGDILVFLSGEREIRDTAEALEKAKLRNTEVVPLYARLSSAEQHRVFQAHTGRRIVLATNVAETSLTVPGIRYVIDPGTARISRYSHRTKVQRLPIEAVSQASANQRKGRCGRTSDGICIRLYSEEDFLSRPEFTDPEILRTNLASVILQMTAAGLGDISAFPFIEPPDRRNIKDGVDLLQELHALESDAAAQQGKAMRLTPIGRKLAQLPVDPRLARMVLEAEKNGVIREVMVIAAALSIQDPRERPVEKRTHADQLHARFTDPTSDFLTYLDLWRYLKQQQKALSSSQFRRMCKAEFLNYLRIREWQDIDAQLRQVAKSLDVDLGAAHMPEEVDGDAVHRSLLSGLLSHVGSKDAEKQEYFGARGAKFAVFPGSALFKKTPAWVMAAELVETSRLWARIAAKVEPQWIEDLAAHLIKRNYSEPHWEKDRGQVVAFERVTLYGLTLVAGRKVGYGSIDPELSRELFIRRALVEGDWRTHHRFFHDNRKLLDEVEELENRARRRDILVDEETLFDFYDQRVGQEVVSGAHFDSWWKKAHRAKPDLLTFTPELLVNDSAEAVTERDYPSVWHQGELELPLTYQFEPGTEQDGVTVHIPLTLLNQVKPAGFDWQIPGLREELVTALIRSLPKALRRNFVPAPDYARRLIQALDAHLDEAEQKPLVEILEWELHRLRGLPVPRDSWNLDAVPDHLRITFRVEDERGRKLAEAKDLDRLKLELKSRTQQAIAKAAGGLEKRGLTKWTIGELPHTFETKRGNATVKGYPALVDDGDSVSVQLLDTPHEQRNAMAAGTRRLILLGVNSPINSIQARLGNGAKLALAANPHGSTEALFADCLTAAADKLIADAGGPAWDGEDYAKLRDHVRGELNEATADAVVKTANILAVHHRVQERLKGIGNSLALLTGLTDVRAQLKELIHPGFVAETGLRRLPDLLRYLKAVERRLVKLTEDPVRDRDRTSAVLRMQDAYAELLEELPPERRDEEGVLQIRWMIEELRVSLWAQPLGTPYSISEQRILKAIDALWD
ncbi:ATP-dependent RNA helicase HrpA [Streptacidiphilus jiangxiensis]|uniref:RNA helicase n=1 Tax=Streptacidiphilus jiangxiensis TaxID=235985 RepID=A0A1H7RYV6_STRJI|nr:ATP-dependent RNA helicase HrpA [Streptacidiphilus jiangxiensis]SEL65422.1 ATP-dependent helicase HrpA [Streptacidiphilus jiangxiensis]